MAVMLSTSLGEVVIDLHTDSCPLACKNFLKLCKIKYYNNCLFHDVQKNFIAQTGDPTGTGRGGDSIYKFLYGDQARCFDDEIRPHMKHDRVGVVAMANAGVENTNASQFYITLREGLDSLDGKHTIFGEVAEGLDVLTRINDAYVDENNRPYKNIRIRHTSILDDPYDDPPALAELIPDRSPEFKPEEGEDVRLEDDWVPMDEQKDPEEVEKIIREREAHSRAVMLEVIGDIPEAEMKPPDNVLFVCKLNPKTQDEDLDVIFSRYGKVISADIIRDHKTGESLCYGFIEFETREACEAAYFKMDNVLLDDRRIHVDFSQSVAKLWNRYSKVGTKDNKEEGAKVRLHYELRDAGGQRGGTGKNYDMVFEHETHRQRGGNPDRNGSDTRSKRRDREEEEHDRRKHARNEEKRRTGEREDGRHRQGVREERRSSSERRHRGEEDVRDDHRDSSRRRGDPPYTRGTQDDREKHSHPETDRETRHSHQERRHQGQDERLRQSHQERRQGQDERQRHSHQDDKGRRREDARHVRERHREDGKRRDYDEEGGRRGQGRR